MHDHEESAKQYAEDAQRGSKQSFNRIVQNMHTAVDMQTDQYHKIMQDLAADKDKGGNGMIGCVIVTEMQRPSLIIDEVINDDGSVTPGRKLLTSIIFKAPIDPFDYCFPLVFDKLTLVYQPTNESWQFMDAIVGLMQPANVNEKTFIATYRGVVRRK